eukprot:1158046-Pelagomonas_calceolata.AAC.6
MQQNAVLAGNFSEGMQAETAPSIVNQGNERKRRHSAAKQLTQRAAPDPDKYIRSCTIHSTVPASLSSSHAGGRPEPASGPADTHL